MTQQQSAPVLRLVLCSDGRPLRRVPPTSAADVCRWFADRVSLVAPPGTLPVLDRWEAELHGKGPPSFPGWIAEGPGRSPVEAAPLIALLRDHAQRNEPLTFNALHLEDQGGRLYPFSIAGYNGPLTISKRQYEAAGRRDSRNMLSAIRRDVRALLQAPQGWSLMGNVKGQNPSRADSTA